MNPAWPSRQFQYCPFCGSKAFHPKGEFSHLCDQCGRSLYTNAAAAVVALLVNEKGEFLLTRRKFEPARGTLDLPGGFVCPGEKAEEAVIREIKEELNVKVIRHRFLASFPNEYLFDGIIYFTLDLAFLCEIEDFSSLQAGDDVEEFVWRAPASISPEEIGLSSIRRMIQFLQARPQKDFLYL